MHFESTMERVRQIKKWYLAGDNRNAVVSRARKAWGITSSTARRYFSYMERDLALKDAKQTDRLRAAAVERCIDHMRECKADGDHAAYLAAMKELHKVQGLHIKRTEVSGSIDVSGEVQHTHTQQLLPGSPEFATAARETRLQLAEPQKPVIDAEVIDIQPVKTDTDQAAKVRNDAP